jgi:hypothetical protein
VNLGVPEPQLYARSGRLAALGLGAVFAGARRRGVIVVATSSSVPNFFSRGMILLFWGFSVVSVSAFRLFAREGLSRCTAAGASRRCWWSVRSPSR